MMFDDETLLFSPWFRIIANRLMIGNDTTSSKTRNKEDAGAWWDDLDRTMNTNDFCDYETIHRFDPPGEHLGGAGNASHLF